MLAHTLRHFRFHTQTKHKKAQTNKNPQAQTSQAQTYRQKHKQAQTYRHKQAEIMQKDEPREFASHFSSKVTVAFVHVENKPKRK